MIDTIGSITRRALAQEGETRRSFLRRTAAWGTVAALAPLLGSCEACQEEIRNRPIRRSLATLDPSDDIITMYRDAVAAMKALPAGDNRNWLRQAQIHQDHCPHQNWYFLPWHRAYLSYFEQICRDLIGEESFALPYWDWTVDASVPAAFWGGTSNALFHPRTATATSTANASLIGRPVIDDILDETDFYLFGSFPSTAQRQRTTYGRLEQTPHNHIHGFVGGEMATFDSPRDPIFWMHHNMIECLWVEWNIVRGNDNTNEAAWMDHVFAQNFFDTAGSPVDIPVGLTLLMPVLSYQFDGECGGAAGPDAMRDALADTAALRARLQRGARPRLRVRRTFDLGRGFTLSTEAPVTSRVALPQDALRDLAGATAGERLLLRISSVRPPRSESFFVRVFVNALDAGPRTSTDSPNYAGSFAFFTDPSHRADASGDAGAFLVDLTDTLRRLGEDGGGLAGVAIRLVAVPVHERAGAARDTFEIEGMTLELADVTAEQ